MIIYSIYRLVNQKTGKCYIGYTQDFEKRMCEHLQDSKRKNTHLCKAIRKHGWDNFQKEIIYQSWEMDHCKNVMESHFIAEYDSYENGYNLTFGGEGAKGPKSNISKKRMSLARKHRFNAKDKDGNIYVITNDDPRFISGELVGIQKGIKPSQETSAKLSIARKGNKNRQGIPHSDEIKKIISERTSAALKGKPKTVVACPHCGKLGGQGNMKRYHFTNCSNIIQTNS